MSETRLCGNPEIIVSYLYDEGGSEERRVFEAHLQTCDSCARDIRELTAVRSGLAQWAPPEPALDFRIVRDETPTRTWLSRFSLPVMPVWAQLGAAALLVGVAMGISGLEVTYGQQGVAIRTGWNRAPVSAPASASASVSADPASSNAAAPWRADLVALEQQLRQELRVSATAGPAATPVATPATSVSGRGMSNDEFMSRVRQLIEASETRQQRELALRIAQVVRDMDGQRRADMVRLTDGMGAIEGSTVSAVAQQRQMLDYLMRVSSQREIR
jgi:hypothetical protein